jgi:hypothetical protein
MARVLFFAITYAPHPGCTGSPWLGNFASPSDIRSAFACNYPETICQRGCVGSVAAMGHREVLCFDTRLKYPLHRRGR